MEAGCDDGYFYDRTAATYDYLSFCSRLKAPYWILYIAVIGFAILLLSPPETPEFEKTVTGELLLSSDVRFHPSVFEKNTLNQKIP